MTAVHTHRHNPKIHVCSHRNKHICTVKNISACEHTHDIMEFIPIVSDPKFPLWLVSQTMVQPWRISLPWLTHTHAQTLKQDASTIHVEKKQLGTFYSEEHKKLLSVTVWNTVTDISATNLWSYTMGLEVFCGKLHQRKSKWQERKKIKGWWISWLKFNSPDTTHSVVKQIPHQWHLSPSPGKVVVRWNPCRSQCERWHSYFGQYTLSAPLLPLQTPLNISLVWTRMKT